MDAKLLQIEVHLFSCLGELTFEVADFVLYGLKVYFWSGLECVYIPRNIEVEIVRHDFLEGCLVGIPFPLLPAVVGFRNLINILLAQAICLLPGSKSRLASMKTMSRM